MDLSYGKLLNHPVREIAKHYGWSIWFCYNDKRKGWRRLSYCRNGWEVPVENKESIKKQVQKLLTGLKIKSEVYWLKSEHARYGGYDKLCIKISD